jgi:hypothetical protein
MDTCPTKLCHKQRRIDMRPTSEELLKGIKDAIDNHILPDLSSPYPMSIAGTVSVLLDHLILRVEKEGQLLAESNWDIRDTLEAALSTLQHSEQASAIPGLLRLERDIREKLSKEHRARDEYPSVRSLTEENNDLRETLIDLLQTVDAAKEHLEADSLTELRGRVTDCSKRQLDREFYLVYTMLEGRR